MKFVKTLVEAGAEINLRDNNQSTAFYWGIYSSNLEILKYLHENGAQLVTTNVVGRTPLVKSAYLCKPDVMKWLLEFQEVRDSIHMVDMNKRNVVHSACWGPKGGRKGKMNNGVLFYDSPECLQYLLDLGVDVSIPQ